MKVEIDLQATDAHGRSFIPGFQEIRHLWVSEHTLLSKGLGFSPIHLIGSYASSTESVVLVS
ncbi:hypothetical protein [Paraburkholderia sp. RL17-347-BIC-D]|uniref:hypothetical protein n=1 Tax=Paraburkholderia sp. RL17-347-BIC-D TaxID=3031632 RepID=UPI0038B6ED38